jgi:tetratricopeptide (TPR) repeat protein
VACFDQRQNHLAPNGAPCLAAQHGPAQPNRLYNLGVRLVASGDLQGALATFRRVVVLDPNDADAVGNLAAVLGDLGQWREAVVHATRAMALRPDANHARNLGIALFECGDYAEAAEAFRAALKHDSTSVELQARLASALTSQGAHDEALAILEVLMFTHPETAVQRPRSWLPSRLRGARRTRWKLLRDSPSHIRSFPWPTRCLAGCI